MIWIVFLPPAVSKDINSWINFIKPPHKLHHSHQSDWHNESFQIVGTSTPWFLLPCIGTLLSLLFSFWCTWLEVFRDFASTRVAGLEFVHLSPKQCFRLFRPACGGLSVDVGKTGEMLRVFVLWVPAWAQGRVHVPRGGIARWMHRWTGVTAVSWRHIWPPGGNRCRVQPRSAAHQARLHSRHLAVELVLWKRRRRGKMLRWCKHKSRKYGANSLA